MRRHKPSEREGRSPSSGNLGILLMGSLQALASRLLRISGVLCSRVSCQSPLLTEYLLAV